MLTEKQIKVMMELVKGTKTRKQIAEECKVSERSIGNWQNNAEFKEEYQKAIDNIFLQASAEALNTILSLMRNADSENVRFNCAKDILSRAGFDATAKTKTELSTPEEIVINIE